MPKFSYKIIRKKSKFLKNAKNFKNNAFLIEASVSQKSFEKIKIVEKL